MLTVSDEVDNRRKVLEEMLESARTHRKELAPARDKHARMVESARSRVLESARTMQTQHAALEGDPIEPIEPKRADSFGTRLRAHLKASQAKPAHGGPVQVRGVPVQ